MEQTDFSQIPNKPEEFYEREQVNSYYIGHDAFNSGGVRSQKSRIRC